MSIHFYVKIYNDAMKYNFIFIRPQCFDYLVDGSADQSTRADAKIK